MRRPVRVPGGWFGIAVVTAFPTAVLALAVYSTWQEEGIGALYLSAGAIATGPILYPILNRYVKKGRPSVEVPIEHDDAPVAAK